MAALKHPLVVEFAGLPAAGKTTMTNLLAAKLRRLGIRTIPLPEAAADCPLIKLKRDWHFNVWTLCHTVERILEAFADDSAEVIIADRGLFDAFCWMEWFKERRSIDLRTASVLQDFAMLHEWAARPHITFLLTVGFATALERRGHTGRIVNLETYTELECAYNNALDRMPEEEKASMEVVATDQLSRNEVLEQTFRTVRNKTEGMDRLIYSPGAPRGPGSVSMSGSPSPKR
jgi:thymidylate kinase